MFGTGAARRGRVIKQRVIAASSAAALGAGLLVGVAALAPTATAATLTRASRRISRCSATEAAAIFGMLDMMPRVIEGHSLSGARSATGRRRQASGVESFTPECGVACSAGMTPRRPAW